MKPLGRPQSIFPGDRYERLVVVRYVKKKSSKLVCKCDCGSKHVMSISSWRRVRSCGCYSLDNPRITHGHSLTPKRTKEYRAWKAIKSRCSNPNSSGYENYGGRGIKVCERWLGKQGFNNFLLDVGFAPTADHSLDRFPNTNGNYETNNVRWATCVEQQRNKRTNRFITLNGITRCIAEWAELIGISQSTLKERLEKGTIKQALTSPAKLQYKKQVNIINNITPELIRLKRLGFHREWLANWYGISSRTVYNITKRAEYVKKT